MNSPFSRLLSRWRLNAVAVLIAAVCACMLATASPFCSSAYGEVERSPIGFEEVASSEATTDTLTNSNKAQSPEDTTDPSVLDTKDADKESSADATPSKDPESATPNDEQETVPPAKEPEPIEKGLVFHTATSTPHLTAYFDGKEAAQSGWVLYEGSWYWFSGSPYATEKSWIRTGNAWYYLDSMGKMSTGVFSDGKGIYVSNANGRMLSNGWVRTAGSWYYLSPSGAAHTGWLKLGSTWYWLDPASGVMGTGWYKDGSTWYFSDSSGAMLANRWLKLGSTWYYLNPSGAMRTGWLKLGSTWYWLDKTSGAMGTAWYKDGSTWYYSNSSGAMLANQWLKLGDTWYYLNPSGAMRTGWLSYRGSWYWLDRSSGAMTTGWVDDNATSYYCDGSGRMLANRWVGSTKGGWHYAEANGAMAAGWRLLSNIWYYFDPADPQHKAKTGLFSVGSNRCYANADGALAVNRWVDIGSGERNYANNQGYLNGRQTKNSSGTYMFVDGNGAPLSGWQAIGGAYFYAQPGTGIMTTGWLQLDSSWYFLNEQGARQTGWVRVGGTWYLLGSDGVMKTGWQKLGGTWYYLRDSGAMATGWLKLGNTWYFLESSGAMATGWRTIGNTSYYFDGSGAWVSNEGAMKNRAQQFSSATPWLLLVDTNTCNVAVFHGSKGNWDLSKYWSCSAGAPETPTIKGSYTVGIKGRYFDSGAARCWWYTQISGDYLFHSTLYYPSGEPMDLRTGINLSHGCVRLDIANAKWIYDNIPAGTKVYIW